MSKENPMKIPRVTKVTLNFGAGKNQDLLEKGYKLLKTLSGMEPSKRITQARIAAWGLRPGLPVGAKVTMRGKSATAIIPRLLHAKDNLLADSCFDNSGNVSFGIPEYIDIQDAKYDASIGIIGLQVSITLERPGYRVARRRMRTGTVHPDHRLKREDTMKFMRENFKVKVAGDDQ